MSERLSAAAVHLLTATGAVFALLALIAATRGDWQCMFNWLGVALIVDTVDGPLARRGGVAGSLPLACRHRPACSTWPTRRARPRTAISSASPYLEPRLPLSLRLHASALPVAAHRRVLCGADLRSNSIRAPRSRG